MQKKTSPITNIWELFEGKQTDWLLTVNGFSASGGDYACFCKLLTSLSRTKDSPETRRYQRLMDALFGIGDPLCQTEAKDVWRRVGESLMQNGRQIEDRLLQAWRESVGEMRPIRVPVEERCVALLDAAPFLMPRRESWKEWEKTTIQAMETALKGEMLPVLTLPADFQPKRTSLYHAEQILSGKVEDSNLWRTQSAFCFLAFCEQRGIRPVLRAECSEQALQELLLSFAARNRLPVLLLQAQFVSRELLFRLCKAIVEGTPASKEGEPPILWSPLQETGETCLPTHLTVRLPSQIA